MTDDLFFWQQIPAAARCVARVAREICAHHMVLLHVPDRLPWKETFRACVEERVHRREAARSLTRVAAEDLGGDLGNYLLHHYCKPDIQKGYRPSFGYASYLARSKDTTLPTSYLWIEHADEAALSGFAAFLGSYREHYQQEKKKQHLHGDGFACLLETEATEPLSPKGLTEIFLAAELTDYDGYIFNIFRAGDVQLCAAPDVAAYLRPYLAELVSHIAGRDIELAAALLGAGGKLLEDPAAAIERVLSGGTYSDGSPFPPAPTADALARALWTTQVRRIFPYLEEQRIAFLERHKQEAAALLPYENGNHETVDDIRSIEIGKIYYEIGQGRIEASPREREAVKLHRSARNDLAHLKPLPLATIKEIYQMQLA